MYINMYQQMINEYVCYMYLDHTSVYKGVITISYVLSHVTCFIHFVSSTCHAFFEESLF